MAMNQQVPASAWVTANSSRYIPIYVQQPVTVFQMATVVAAQSGNCDVGIYDEFGTRLVSSGTTAVGAVGYQIFNIADTALQPGTYYMAMGCDNVTASFNRINWVTAANGAVNGCLTQTVYPLPATWTTPTSATHTPHLIAHTVAVA
jgi:hypothetical protein